MKFNTRLGRLLVLVSSALILSGCASVTTEVSEGAVYCNDVKHSAGWICAGAGGGRGKPPT